MILMIAILTGINIPIGYFVCRALKLKTYLRIFFVGILQYVLSALIIAVIMAASERNFFSLTRLLELVYIWIYGMGVFAIIVLPVIALAAWVIQKILNGKQA